MSHLADVIARLDRVRYPADLSFDRGGRSIVASVHPASREKNQSFQSRIWRFALDGSALQLTEGPNGDYLPRCSPVDGRIAFASDRTTPGKAELFLLKDGAVRPCGRLAGTIEDLRWSADGAALIVQTADAGLDNAATNGAARICWADGEDPAVTTPDGARRRLFRVETGDGGVAEVGPRDRTVWEYDLLGSDAAIVLASTDFSERGWYHAAICRIDFAARALRVFYESPWQMQSVVVSPSGKSVAFVEGWASDRGLVGGEMRVLDIATGKVTSLAAGEQSSVTSLAWRDEESLWFTGWSGLGTVYGVVRLDGAISWSTREDAMIGPTSFLAAITPAPDGQGFAAIREAVGQPPEIVFKPSRDAAWQQVTKLNADIMAGFAGYPEVRTVTWRGTDGREIEGMLLLAKDRAARPGPMVVDIHGGPTWSAKLSFNPGYALTSFAAGYSVFLPNYRGSTGRGQAFSRLNIGDPGGGEFDDILAGVDWCIAQGIADPERLGVTGVSYGGYMTAWAVARCNRFKAAVMISGIANQWSCHYSCNHHYAEFLFGGPLSQPRIRDLAIERSPIYRLDRPTTPTLIVHGENDRCTPLGQAHEFYSALLERGVHAELVVYPREGHGVKERIHQADRPSRTAAWFDRYLRAGG